MQIIFLPKFSRHFKKLSEQVRFLAEKKIKIFSENPSDPRLHLHKLHGELEGLHAFYLSYDIRVIVDIKTSEYAYLVDIGSHNIYD